MNNTFNLEDEFLKLRNNPELFPNAPNYIDIYNVFIQRFNKEIHPEVKTKILEIEKEGYFNDHGVEHIKMVVERVSRILDCANASLLEDNGDFYISPYESFILLMAINLHDTGHLIVSRKEHADAGRKILRSFDKDAYLTSGEKRIIGDIAKAHGGKNNPIGNLEQKTHIKHFEIRPQLLAALLRLGDELAEDETRASNFLLNQLDNIPESSKIYHYYSSSLESVMLNNHEISLKFYFNETVSMKTFTKIDKGKEIQTYLLDEIYSRTLKTFTEALYCNRFLDYNLRFEKVKVSISILDDDNKETEKIDYILVESFYPNVVVNDIYDLCSDTLMDGVNQKNGEYYANLIKNKTESHESI